MGCGHGEAGRVSQTTPLSGAKASPAASRPFCAAFALGVNAEEEEAETGRTSDSTKRLLQSGRVPGPARPA